MTECIDTLLGVLNGLFQEDAKCLAQMEYLQEMLYDPVANSCGASFQFTASPGGLCPPPAGGRSSTQVPPPSPLHVNIKRTDTKHNAATSLSRASLTPAPNATQILTFRVFWEVFGNFSLLHQAQRQLHRHHESLCHTLTLRGRRSSRAPLSLTLPTPSNGMHPLNETGFHAPMELENSFAKCHHHSLDAPPRAWRGLTGHTDQTLSVHPRVQSFSTQPRQCLSAVEESASRRPRRRDRSLPASPLAPSALSRQASTSSVAGPRSAAPSHPHSTSRSPKPERKEEAKDKISTHRRIRQFLSRGNSPKGEGNNNNRRKTSLSKGSVPLTAHHVTPPTSTGSFHLGGESLGPGLHPGSQSLTSSHVPHGPSQGVASLSVFKPRQNLAELVVDFFTSDEMKYFMLEFFMYTNHFCSHVIERVVEMRRLWRKATLPARNKTAAAGSSFGAARPSSRGANETVPHTAGTPILSNLSHEEQEVFKEYAEFISFLRRVLGPSGHPNDPRVTKTHYPEGCPQRLYQLRTGRSKEAEVEESTVNSLFTGSQWEGWDTLLLLLGTPLSSLTRYLFRARILLETKALEASSPAAARRLQAEFVDVVAERVGSIVAVVMDTIARRDVKMILSHFDPVEAVLPLGSGGGFLSRYKPPPLSSNTFCTTAAQFIQLVEALTEEKCLSPSASKKLLEKFMASGNVRSGGKLAATNGVNGVALPLFSLWESLVTSPSRALLLYGQLTVVVTPSSKKTKTISRMVFLFSDSVICAEEQSRTGRLRLETFFLLRNAKVRSLPSSRSNGSGKRLEVFAPVLGPRMDASGSPASPLRGDHAHQLSPYPNAFTLHTPLTGELILVADTSEEKHYWIKAIQKAIQFQVILQQRHAESARTGEPVMKIPVTQKPSSWSSRLARQRRDDVQLQQAMDPQHGTAVHNNPILGTPEGADNPGSRRIVGNSSFTSATVFSRLGGSQDGTPRTAPPPSSYIKREVSANNWSVLGSIHGRMGSLSLRKPDHKDEPEDPQKRSSVVEKPSESAAEGTVTPLQKNGRDASGTDSNRLPTEGSKRLRVVATASRMSSLRRVGLDGTVPVSPTPPSEEEDRSEGIGSGENTLSSPSESVQPGEPRAPSRPNEVSVTSMPDGLRTVFSNHHTKENKPGKAEPHSDPGEDEKSSSRAASPSPSDQLWNLDVSEPHSQRDSSSTYSSSSSMSSTSAGVKNSSAAKSSVTGRNHDEEHGYFGQPMSAFRRSKRREASFIRTSSAVYRRTNSLHSWQLSRMNGSTATSVTPTVPLGRSQQQVRQPKSG